MILQGSKGAREPDKVFIVCHSGDTGTIPRGDVLCWDYTDIGSGRGIQYGNRVVRCSLTAPATTVGRFDVAGVAETSAPPAFATTIGPNILVQVYGFHDSVRYNPNSVAIGNGTLRTNNAALDAGATAGEGLAFDMATVGAGFEPENNAGRFGFAMSASATRGNYPAIIRNM